MTNAIETVIFSIAVEQETDEDWQKQKEVIDSFLRRAYDLK